jgi:hypothetical protein
MDLCVILVFNGDGEGIEHIEELEGGLAGELRHLLKDQLRVGHGMFS